MGGKTKKRRKGVHLTEELARIPDTLTEPAADLTLTGDLTLADGATVTCNVFTNGTCDSVAIAGSLAFGGAVRLQYKAADASRPEIGSYTLFTADSITGFDASAWTLETSGVRLRPAHVSCDGHSVVLTVGEFGTRIMLR